MKSSILLGDEYQLWESEEMEQEVEEQEMEEQEIPEQEGQEVQGEGQAFPKILLCG